MSNVSEFTCVRRGNIAVKNLQMKSPYKNEHIRFLLSEKGCSCTIPGGFFLGFSPLQRKFINLFTVQGLIAVFNICCDIFVLARASFQTRRPVAGFCCCIVDIRNACYPYSTGAPRISRQNRCYHLQYCLFISLTQKRRSAKI